MFYLQTASPQSGTDFWVTEKGYSCALELCQAELDNTLIKANQRGEEKKNDKKTREIHDCKPPKIGLAMELLLQSGFSFSKKILLLKQEKCPKQQGTATKCIFMVYFGFNHNLNTGSQIYFTLIALKNVNIPTELSFSST